MSESESVLVFSRSELAHRATGSSGLLFGSGSHKLRISACENSTGFGRGWMGEGECEVGSADIWQLIDCAHFRGEEIG